MLNDRWLQPSWLPTGLRGWLGRLGFREEAPAPIHTARTMRLSYLSSQRAEMRPFATQRLSPYLPPLLLREGLELFVPHGLLHSPDPIDLILHVRGGQPERLDPLKTPALILRADTPGLAGALLQRFGQADFVPWAFAEAQRQCRSQFDWQPVIRRRVLSSFGCGYAPVGVALRDPAVRALVDVLFVLDGIHYGAPGQPDRAAHAPFVAFAQAAARGEKQMIVTHTAIQSPYASSTDAANLLIQAVGARRRRCDPALANDWHPSSRADKKGFHVLGYPGRLPMGHIAQIQQMGGLWEQYLASAN
ncbi:MAG: hypothetical protein ACO1RX_10685 [Candidatus Sericytochromatia bacterium]